MAPDLEEAQPDTPPKPRPKARLTVVETVYHQIVGDQPTQVDSRFGRWLDVDEQAWGPRRIKVGESWKPLDTDAWVINCSMFMLSNEEGRFDLKPSPAQRAEADAKIVVLGIKGPDSLGGMITEVGLARPGQSLRLEPIDISALRVKCRAGSAICKVTFVPG